MKMLPSTKMRSMDLQKHLQEFREKLRKQKIIDEIQPITGVHIANKNPTSSSIEPQKQKDNS
jgi:hypothetical protein